MTAPAGPAYAVEVVDALECRYDPTPWPFAVEQRDAIARHWAEALRARPTLFNGRVLIQTQGAVERGPAGAVFRAAYTDIDFAAFLAWRDWSFPAGGVRNGFGMAALQSAEGVFVLGEMAPHTANAGRIYFPSGTPDLGDVDGGTVDILGSIRRELAEETGLDTAALDFDPAITVLSDAARVCFMQRVRSREPAAALKARIEVALAGQAAPELARLHLVRSVADLAPAMQPFVAQYLRLAFAAAQPG